MSSILLTSSCCHFTRTTLLMSWNREYHLFLICISVCPSSLKTTMHCLSLSNQIHELSWYKAKKMAVSAHLPLGMSPMNMTPSCISSTVLTSLYLSSLTRNDKGASVRLHGHCPIHVTNKILKIFKYTSNTNLILTESQCGLAQTSNGVA